MTKAAAIRIRRELTGRCLKLKIIWGRLFIRCSQHLQKRKDLAGFNLITLQVELDHFSPAARSMRVAMPGIKLVVYAFTPEQFAKFVVIMLKRVGLAYGK